MTEISMHSKWIVRLAPWLIVVLMGACKTTEQTSDAALRESILQDLQNQPSIESGDLEKEQVEELEKNISEYRASRTMLHQLVHTKLEVRFDWKNEQLFGVATIDLKPHFYPQDSLVLDARAFDIHCVELIENGKEIQMSYKYVKDQIIIQLPSQKQRDEIYRVKIDYTANPAKIMPRKGEAITGNRGLYFINPTGEESDKPMQIWTQGETESNSGWFPTIDAPNQRCTQEIFITIEDSFVTLSNGKLISSTGAGDGMRTDYWRMDKPHAPYLFMMAIGEYAVIEDEWNDIPLTYYVEPAYAPYAKDIFGNTPEMLTFFSELIDYPYPWNKYAQVVVREFVSGAMENTTASVFMDRVQATRRELMDDDWDYIIAHELFHQWFGNLVTCESWANTPLNEAFANYSEYLWKYHKLGKDEADLHLSKELDSYLNEADDEKKDLIRFFYSHQDDMFDNHSYAKGGLILHLLRTHIGDDAFFAALSHYLRQHEYSAVEVHQLRLAFEHVTGTDLNWFFNQWFLDKGHPELKVNHKYSASAKELTVEIEQVQNLSESPLYRLPIDLEVWSDGKSWKLRAEIMQQKQSFVFAMEKQPELVIVDPQHTIPGLVVHPKSKDELFHQVANASNIRSRINAIEEIIELDNKEDQLKVAQLALKDDFWAVRQQAIDLFSTYSYSELDSIGVLNDLVEIAYHEEETMLRSDAISLLTSLDTEKYVDYLRQCAYDSSYAVAATCLSGYLQSAAEDKSQLIQDFEKESNPGIVITLADHFAFEELHGRYGWFEAKLSGARSETQWYLVRLLGQLLMKAPEEQQKVGAELLEGYATNASMFYVRLGAYQALELLEEVEGVKEKLKNIREKEKEDKLRMYYQSLSH
ncbi:MAG: M1 family metallopeptidase [Cyclobacteriaceae bacterium]